MKTLFAMLCLVSLALCRDASAQQNETAQAKKVQHNVVSLHTEYGEGWGFIVGKKDNRLYIVTANHVVRGAQDGGPGGNVIKVKFFTNQGEEFDALLESQWISSKQQDLAMLTISEPPVYKYHRADFGCFKHDLRNTQVWFVGKGKRWFIPSTAGRIDSLYQDKMSIHGLQDATSGSSGAPIFSNKGFEGMLLGPTPSGTSIEALSLKYIHSKLEEWKYPYAGRQIKKSTYIWAASSAAFVAGGFVFASKKNDSYDVYKQYRDETAPIYQTTKSREEYFKEAKRFQTRERISFVLGGACALTAYLINKNCLFHKRKLKSDEHKIATLQKVDWLYDARNKTSSVGIQWSF